jgi:hypothetical protein
MRPSRRALTVWLAIYLVTLSGAIWGTFAARDWVINRVGDEQSAADWETWKQQAAAENEREDAPVIRRLSDGPDSHEPPSLVLMRDNFPTILGFGLLLGTLLFAFFAFVVHGMLFTPAPKIDAPSDDDQPRA